MFEIIPEIDISLAEVRQQVQSRRPVLQMPHMGNTTLSRVLVSNLGVKSIFYPWTKGTIDKNQPHGIRKDGKLTVMADPTIFAGYAESVDGTPMANHHLGAFGQVAQGEILTYLDYLSVNHDLVLRLLEAIFVQGLSRTDVDKQDLACWWGRCVNERGEETNKIAVSFETLLEHGIAGVTQKHGFIIPLRQTVFITTVIEAMHGDVSEVMHFGGRTFLEHVLRWKDGLDSLVDMTKDKTGIDRLRLRVPSLGDLSFVVPSDLSASADLLFHLMETFRRHPTNINHLALLQSLKPCQSAFEIAMTQHDLSARNATAYVPDEMLRMPMRSVLAWCRELAHIRSKLRFARFKHLA